MMTMQLRVTIESQRGRIRGEVGDPKSGCLKARVFASGIRSLRDSAAGSGGGRRQHQPLSFTKDVGEATPQLAQLACSGEVLRSVLCEFMRFADGGQDEVFFTVRLCDATVSGHRLIMTDDADGRPFIEEVDLTYRRIEWEHRAGKTMSADEWA